VFMQSLKIRPFVDPEKFPLSKKLIFFVFLKKYWTLRKK